MRFEDIENYIELMEGVSVDDLSGFVATVLSFFEQGTDLETDQIKTLLEKLRSEFSDYQTNNQDLLDTYMVDHGVNVYENTLKQINDYSNSNINSQSGKLNVYEFFKEHKKGIAVLATASIGVGIVAGVGSRLMQQVDSKIETRASLYTELTALLSSSIARELYTEETLADYDATITAGRQLTERSSKDDLRNAIDNITTAEKNLAYLEKITSAQAGSDGHSDDVDKEVYTYETLQEYIETLEQALADGVYDEYYTATILAIIEEAKLLEDTATSEEINEMISKMIKTSTIAVGMDPEKADLLTLSKVKDYNPNVEKDMMVLTEIVIREGARLGIQLTTQEAYTIVWAMNKDNAINKTAGAIGMSEYLPLIMDLPSDFTMAFTDALTKIQDTQRDYRVVFRWSLVATDTELKEELETVENQLEKDLETKDFAKTTTLISNTITNEESDFNYKKHSAVAVVYANIMEAIKHTNGATNKNYDLINKIYGKELGATIEEYCRYAVYLLANTTFSTSVDHTKDNVSKLLTDMADRFRMDANYAKESQESYDRYIAYIEKVIEDTILVSLPNIQQEEYATERAKQNASASRTSTRVYTSSATKAAQDAEIMDKETVTAELADGVDGSLKDGNLTFGDGEELHEVYEEAQDPDSLDKEAMTPEEILDQEQQVKDDANNSDPTEEYFDAEAAAKQAETDPELAALLEQWLAEEDRLNQNNGDSSSEIVAGKIVGGDGYTNPTEQSSSTNEHTDSTTNQSASTSTNTTDSTTTSKPDTEVVYGDVVVGEIVGGDGYEESYNQNTSTNAYYSSSVSWADPDVNSSDEEYGQSYTR